MPRDDYDRERRRTRDYDRDDRRDRGFVERMEDEVKSWFSDDDADHRRRRDRREQPSRSDYDRDDDRGGYRGYTREGYGRDYNRDVYRGDSHRGYDRDYDRDDDRGYGRSNYGARSGERGYERTHARSGYGQDYYDPYDYRRKYASEGEDDDYRGYGRVDSEDWMTEGEHTGRGPKGYRRSDERVSEEVCERLERHGQVDASEIEVRVEDGEVTLTGTVANRRMKRLAEDAAESIYGVRDVHNHLRVQEGSGVTVAGTTDEGVMGS